MTDRPAYTCHACRAVFDLRPAPMAKTAITRCSMRYANGQTCGRRYWHGKDGEKVRQGIDPAWLENAAAGTRATKPPGRPFFDRQPVVHRRSGGAA